MDFQKDFTKFQFAVVRTLWETRGATRRTLGNTIGISRPTLDKTIKALEARKMVTIGSATAETGGRPANVVRLRDRAWLTIGVDLGLPDVTIVLTDVWGSILEETMLQLRGSLDEPNVILTRLVREIRAWLDTVRTPSFKLGAVGIGLPGFFSRNGVSFVGHHLPQWREIRVKEYLEQELSLRIVILHDVHCMAQAEVDHRSWADKVVLFLSVRPGIEEDLRIGASLCVDGQAYFGGGGNGGALYRAVVDGEKLSGRTESETVEIVAEHLAGSLSHIIPLTDPDWVVIRAECLGELEPRTIDHCQRKLEGMLHGEYAGFSAILPAASREKTGARQAALAAIRTVLQPTTGSTAGNKGGATGARKGVYEQ